MANDLTPSFIRTAVPLLVGPLVTLLGLSPDDPMAAVAVSAAISYGYYVVVRVLELKLPMLGYLLGVNKQPVYVKAPAVITDAGGVRRVAPDDGPAS